MPAKKAIKIKIKDNTKKITKKPAGKSKSMTAVKTVIPKKPVKKVVNITEKKSSVAKKAVVKKKNKPSILKRPGAAKTKEKVSAAKKKAAITKPKVAIKKKIAVDNSRKASILAEIESKEEIIPIKTVKNKIDIIKPEKTENEEKMPAMPMPNKTRERISIVNEDKKDELLLKGSYAVRNVIKSSIQKKEEEEIEKVIDQKVSGSRSVKIYRKIALSFVVLTLVLLVVIFYFSFVKVTIVLIPNQERISNNMIFDIYDSEKHESLKNNSISGLVKKVKIKNSKEFDASGVEVIGKEAIGKVKLINNYTKNQPLVATTRLLTPDGKLFRISETVNVPVGGFVEVEIYADEPGPEMAVGPTKFTIPGLWAGIQDKVYAESTEDVVYRQKVKKHIIEEDIDNGIRDLKKELLAGAKAEINEKYKEYDQIIYKIDENSIESNVDGKTGEEKDTFTVVMEAEVIVVAYNEDTAIELAKQKFTSSLSENKELLSFDEKNIIYTLNKYDYVEGTATINSTFEGKVAMKEDSEIIETDKILGLNREQLEVYLEEIPEIAGYEIEFYPTFIKKVPRLVDRVNIEIKK